MTGLRRERQRPADSFVDLLRDVSRIPSYPREQHRAERVLKRQSAEEETGSFWHHAAPLPRPAVGVEDRQVDPVEYLAKAGAPHDVGDVEHPALARTGRPLSAPLTRSRILSTPRVKV